MLRLALAVALALSAGAAAQTPPPDERAAARAFADATARLKATVNGREREIRRIETALQRGCPRLQRRVPDARQPMLAAILQRHDYYAVADLLDEPLGRVRTDLANVPTRDRRLVSGRAAWRQATSFLMARPPARDPCAEVRGWLRAGMPRSHARKADRDVEAVQDAVGGKREEKMRRAGLRMTKLGVSLGDTAPFRGSALQYFGELVGPDPVPWD